MNKKSFQIKEMSVEQFATFPLPETESKRVNIGLNIDLAFNDEKRIINCSIKVTMRLLEDIIITLQVKCVYSVESEELKKWAEDAELVTQVPLQLIQEIADQTFATTRGVLYAKTEKTEYNIFVLPVFELTDAIKAAV